MEHPSDKNIYVLPTKRRLGIEIVENTCSSVLKHGGPSASIRCLSETPIRNGFVRRRSYVVNILSFISAFAIDRPISADGRSCEFAGLRPDQSLAFGVSSNGIL